jgi:hypothetical protein
VSRLAAERLRVNESTPVYNRSSPPNDRHGAELTLLSVRRFIPPIVVRAFLVLLIVARAFYAAFPDRDFLARRKSSCRNAAHRWTSTGILQCVRTLTVSLPRTSAEMPWRPCEAMTIRSQLFDSAMLMIAR